MAEQATALMRLREAFSDLCDINVDIMCDTVKSHVQRASRCATFDQTSVQQFQRANIQYAQARQVFIEAWTKHLMKESAT